jgi:hypothetical protein
MSHMFRVLLIIHKVRRRCRGVIWRALTFTTTSKSSHSRPYPSCWHRRWSWHCPCLCHPSCLCHPFLSHGCPPRTRGIPKCTAWQTRSHTLHIRPPADGLAHARYHPHNGLICCNVWPATRCSYDCTHPPTPRCVFHHVSATGACVRHADSNPNVYVSLTGCKCLYVQRQCRCAPVAH